MAKKKYYAVRVGKKAGIYNTWVECQKQTKGISGAVFKSFLTIEEAEKFLNPDKTHNLSQEDDYKTVNIYIDGSFEQSIKRYSFGLVVDNEERTSMNKGFDDSRFLASRNVSGELLGAMYAYQWILDNKEENVLYKIHYDYEGIEKWATKQWKTNKALTKCYAAISQHVMKLVAIEFIKVAAHTGVELNEVVDELAKEALHMEASKIEFSYIDFEDEISKYEDNPKK